MIPGEFARIRAFSRLAPTGPGVVLGIGDDAAVLTATPGRDLVVTQDALVEGVHFRRAWQPAESLGRKAVAVSLSDVAAMGATPRFVLLTLAVPTDLPASWATSAVRGAVERAGGAGAYLVGGDTVRSVGPIMIDCTCIGEVLSGQAASRGGALPGDYLAVTGSVGAAAAGLRLLEEGVPPGLSAAVADALRRALLDPPARLAEGRRLAVWAHALVDLSDGVAGAAQAICRASNVGCRLDGRALPVAAAARRYAQARGIDPLDLALTGGEDYELMAALPAGPDGQPPELPDVPLTLIGRVTAATARVVVRPDGSRHRLPGGYDAFTAAVTPD
jgi:thiamine-monophosphate kinase